MKTLLMIAVLLGSSSLSLHAMTVAELKAKCQADKSFCDGYASSAVDYLSQDSSEIAKKFCIPTGTPIALVVVSAELLFLPSIASVNPDSSGSTKSKLTAADAAMDAKDASAVIKHHLEESYPCK